MRLYAWDYAINRNENEDENEKYSHSCDINRSRFRRGQKYCKYKKCLTMMMLIRIKQQLSNIWTSTHQKVKQQGGLVENSMICFK